MNALFLKDLADKTRRGLRGRVEAGKSGGGLCYGYWVVRSLSGTSVTTGEREIEPDEAAVVERIFREFIGGASPKQIAKRPERGRRSPRPEPRALRRRRSVVGEMRGRQRPTTSCSGDLSHKAACQSRIYSVRPKDASETPARRLATGECGHAHRRCRRPAGRATRPKQEERYAAIAISTGSKATAST